MIRALRTAASGMKSQQINVDTIANNIANINTNSYKKQRVEFKDLMYANLEKANVKKEGKNDKVSNVQVGHGVRPMSISKSFETGNIEQTGNNLDIAIEGKGFFEVIATGGERAYTKDGSFKMSSLDGIVTMVTADGYAVVDEDDEPISFGDEVDIAKISISADGTMKYRNAEGTLEDLGKKMKTVTFTNMQGLDAMGQNLYGATDISGEAVLEDGETITKSNLKQGFIERSNVQIAEEMVKLITAQRAYEINSKAIQTADEMLQQANNLRR